LLCLVVLGIVVCVRRSARKGYRQIEQEGWFDIFQRELFNWQFGYRTCQINVVW
jgi:hypothetical protein